MPAIGCTACADAALELEVLRFQELRSRQRSRWMSFGVRLPFAKITRSPIIRNSGGTVGCLTLR
jgi:hypothetical protein